MASNAIKSPLPGDSLYPSEVQTKAALDERDEKSIIRVGFGSAAFDTPNVFLPIFYDIGMRQASSSQHHRTRSLHVYVVIDTWY